MLSIDHDLSVPGFKRKEIGVGTLVRVHDANLEIQLTNDGQTYLRKLKVKPVIESYVGQNKPILFLYMDEEIIDEIPPKSMVSLTISIWHNFSGVVSVALYITDANDKAVMAKRQRDTTYQGLPVRWWFNVVDNISIEILRTLKTLVAQNEKIQKDLDRKLKEAAK